RQATRQYADPGRRLRARRRVEDRRRDGELDQLRDRRAIRLSHSQLRGLGLLIGKGVAEVAAPVVATLHESQRGRIFGRARSSTTARVEDEQRREARAERRERGRIG